MIQPKPPQPNAPLPFPQQLFVLVFIFRFLLFSIGLATAAAVAAPAAIAAEDVHKEFQDHNDNNQVDDPIEITPTTTVIASAKIKHYSSLLFGFSVFSHFQTARFAPFGPVALIKLRRYHYPGRSLASAGFEQAVFFGKIRFLIVL